MGAVANAGAAGNDAHAVGEGHGMERVSGFIEEGEAGGVEGEIGGNAHAEAEEDAFFHPGIDAPAGGGDGIGLGGADFAAVESEFEGAEEIEMAVGVDGWG